MTPRSSRKLRPANSYSPRIEVGAAGQARRRDVAADRKIGPPQAVDAEPAHGQVAARDLHVELPRRQLARSRSLRPRRGRHGGPAAAARPPRALAWPSVKRPVVELQLAGDAAAAPARADGDRPGDGGGEVVAVEQLRLLRR